MNPRNIDQKAAENLAIKILAIVGLIALLALIAWGGTYAIRKAPDAFSSISNTIQAAAVTLTSIFVPAEEVQEETPVDTESEEEDTETEENDVPSEGTGSGSVTRTPGTETSSTFPINENSTVVSDPNGRADLAPRLLAVGVVDEDGNFTEKDEVDQSDRIAVRFAVENLGTKTSETWRFTAVLPTHTIHFFDSPTQQALRPGDRIEYTLGFDGVKDNEKVTFTVNVDPSKSVPEVTKNNNILKVEINVKTD
ncbi:MAG: CARDB domain-containing protein [Candidatus Paceibacterota bacterium]